MSPESVAKQVSSLGSSSRTLRRLRNQSLLNLSCMGHCAPTVMKTMLDVSGADADWLVKLTAGLPGGIGNTGGECGGVTAPLLLLGLCYGLEASDRNPLLVVQKGRELLERFTALHGTTSCREIRGNQRVPLRCVGVVREAAAQCALTAGSDGTDPVADESEVPYARLYAHWVDEGFHCAHAVFRNMGGAIPATQELLDATAGFMGGTVFTGMTCSALTAGVMALGLARGEIENSHLRVLRMIGTMAMGGDAFAESLNAFNRTMNLGHQLSRWFVAQYGSTQCCAITQCDFSTTEGVRSYIDSGGTMRCSAIAEGVARRVQDMLQPERAAGSAIDRASTA